MTRILLLLLRAYRLALSPLLGNQCRFAPTCSQYAIEAVARFGAARGAWLALGRLLRCHPWKAGGWDPVPTLAQGARGGCACSSARGPCGHEALSGAAREAGRRDGIL